MQVLDILDVIEKAWAELFGLPSLASDANFFELGGDSLLATILAFRIEEAIEHPIDPNLLFEHPTLEAFAGAVREQLASS